MSVQATSGPVAKAAMENSSGTTVGYSAPSSSAAPPGKPGQSPNFALAWQFVSGLPGGGPPQMVYRAAKSPGPLQRAGSPPVAGIRSPRAGAASPPLAIRKSSAALPPANKSFAPPMSQLGATAPPNGRVVSACGGGQVQFVPGPHGHPMRHTRPEHVSPRLGAQPPPVRHASPPQPVRVQHHSDHPSATDSHSPHPCVLGRNASLQQMRIQHSPGEHGTFPGPMDRQGSPRPCNHPVRPTSPLHPKAPHVHPHHPAIREPEHTKPSHMTPAIPKHPSPALPPPETTPGVLPPNRAQVTIRADSCLHAGKESQRTSLYSTPPSETQVPSVPSQRASNATLSPPPTPLRNYRAVTDVQQSHSVSSPPRPILTEGIDATPGRLAATQLLWTLRCTSCEVAVAQRSLLHQWEAGCELPSTQRVGQLFQKEFFEDLLSEEEAALVDREHFQIWAVGSSDSDTDLRQRTSCTFFLTNYSSNGTMVNNQLLSIGGEQVPLADGDRIALLRPGGGPPNPLMEFRFDLSGSLLKGLGPWLLPSRHVQLRAGAAGPAPLQTVLLPSAAPEPAPPTPREAMPLKTSTTDLEDGPDTETREAPTAPTVTGFLDLPRSVDGMSFLGVQLLPLFALEVGGQGLRTDVPKEDLRIVHGPARAEGGKIGSCLPLLLGRSPQRSYWQRLLNSDALYALSRQHLQIEVGEEISLTSRSAAFYVRNLSASNPIRLCRTLVPEEFASAVPLSHGGRRPLQNRDIIVLNPVQGFSLWLVFRDLWTDRADGPGPANENNANASESNGGA